MPFNICRNYRVMPKYYRLNGAIYIAETNYFYQTNGFIDNNTQVVTMENIKYSGLYIANTIKYIVINIFGEHMQDKKLIILKNETDNYLPMNLNGIKRKKQKYQLLLAKLMTIINLK